MPLGIAKIGLINGITGEQYEGTDVSADLLWHMRMIPVSSFGRHMMSQLQMVMNQMGSIKWNNRSFFASNVIVYDGNQGFWSWEYWCIWRETCKS